MARKDVKTVDSDRAGSRTIDDPFYGVRNYTHSARGSSGRALVFDGIGKVVTNDCGFLGGVVLRGM